VGSPQARGDVLKGRAKGASYKHGTREGCHYHDTRSRIVSSRKNGQSCILLDCQGSIDGREPGTRKECHYISMHQIKVDRALRKCKGGVNKPIKERRRSEKKLNRGGK